MLSMNMRRPMFDNLFPFLGLCETMYIETAFEIKNITFMCINQRFTRLGKNVHARKCRDTIVDVSAY